MRHSIQRIEPIFEPTFLNGNYGYCKGRSAHDAMRQVWQNLTDGYVWVLDADLREFFDTIDQETLIDLIAEEISDGCVLQLVRSILRSHRRKPLAANGDRRSPGWSCQSVVVECVLDSI